MPQDRKGRQERKRSDVSGLLGRGRRTRVRLQGTEWTAVNVGPDSIPHGSGAVVVDTDGVALEIVEAVPPEPPVH